MAATTARDLYDAAARGDRRVVFEIVTRCLSDLIEMKEQYIDTNGHSAVSIAIHNGHIDIAKSLVLFLDVTRDRMSLIEASIREDELELMEMICRKYRFCGIDPVQKCKQLWNDHVSALHQEVETLQQKVEQEEQEYNAKVQKKEELLQQQVDTLRRKLRINQAMT